LHAIAESRQGDISIIARYETCRLPRDSMRIALLNQLRHKARYLDSGSRHDAFTFEIAMEYLEKIRPEHLDISFDETDDWAHNKRYAPVHDDACGHRRSRPWRYAE